MIEKDDLKYYRIALGIVMVWNPFPLIFTIRDGLRVGGGSTFTFAFMVVGLILMFPLNIFKKIELPNMTLFFFWFSFVVLALIYMLFYPSLHYNYRSQLAKEILTYIFPLLFLIGTMYYPNQKADKILIVILLYGILGSLGLMYSLLHDPNWKLGERAAIKFLTSTEQSNPHVFANNALYGILSGLILASRARNVVQEILYYISVICCLIVIVLCRTNTSILCLFVFGFIYLLLNFKQTVVNTFKLRTLGIISAFIVVLIWAARQFSTVTSILQSYFNNSNQRLVNLAYTISGAKLSNKQVVEVDESSITRVRSYNYVKSLFTDGQWSDILVGEGYKSQFLDIPILESLTNHGIIGFILFTSFLVTLAVIAFFQILRPSTGLSLFLGYFTIVSLLASVSGSRPVDMGTWIVYVMFIRFLGASYNKSTTNGAVLS